MLKHMPWEWERLDDTTDRAKVIGGWLIRSTYNGESMCFLVDRDLEWCITEPKADPIVEQSTLAQDFASVEL
jgi:hypothetical protein